jgi:hypothetical protein
MLPLVLIDTSAWICFFSRRGYGEIQKALPLLLDENRSAITRPIWIELIQGTRTMEEKEKDSHFELIARHSPPKVFLMSFFSTFNRVPVDIPRCSGF